MKLVWWVENEIADWLSRDRLDQCAHKWMTRGVTGRHELELDQNVAELFKKGLAPGNCKSI